MIAGEETNINELEVPAEKAAAHLSRRVTSAVCFDGVEKQRAKSHHYPYNPKCPVCTKAVGRARAHNGLDVQGIGTKPIDLVQLGKGGKTMIVGGCSGKDGQRRLVEAIGIVGKDYDSAIKGIRKLISSLECHWQGDRIRRVHADTESAIGKAEDDLNR